MELGIGLKIFFSILSFLGAISLAFIMFYVSEAIGVKIKEIKKRQSKIRCLCEHEYEFHCKFYYGRDLDEYCYVCRKCNKVLKFKVADKSEVGCE